MISKSRDITPVRYNNTKTNETNAITLKPETLANDDDLKDRVSFNIVLDPAAPDDKTKISISKYGSGSA